jgi:hypothetical protein
MLPPGHIAAGYLTGLALLKITRPALGPAQTNSLLVWAAFFGFAPDLDAFYFFFKNRTFLVGKEIGANKNHRFYWSHAPVLWLLAGLAVYFLANNTYIKFVGLLLWLGSWSHFLLDSVEYGIMWLWPFSTKIYALKNLDIIPIPESGFINHTWKFLKIYSARISFYLEILIIILALTIYFH